MPAALPPYRDINCVAWPAGHGMDWHAHAMYQVIHVLAGVLEVDWGTGWCRMGPGDAHVLPAKHRHRLRTAGGHRQLGVNCSEAGDERGVIAALRAAFPRPAIVRVAADGLAVAGVRAAADGVLSQAELGRGSGANLVPGGGGLAPAGLRLYAALDHYCLALIEAAAPRPGGGLAQRLLDHLRARDARPLAVAAAARALAVSRATLQRACRAAFACGVAGLHQRVRLARAAQLLLEGDGSVAACAAACGYPDVYGFSRAFRRVHGLPPARFRRERRQRGG